MRQGATIAALALAFVFDLGLPTSQSAEAQTLTVLHKFKGGADGATPLAGLVRDNAGNLYGTTSAGGHSTCRRVDTGCGTVFKVDRIGKKTVLYRFTGGADGEYPEAGLVRDNAGNLYGATYFGGTYDDGTVFRVNKTGKHTVLYSFSGAPDGKNPYGALVRDAAGNLFGTTENGGAGYGTIFKLSKSGKETVLHYFGMESLDGKYPNLTALLMDTEGNLYGVTQDGYSECEGIGCGTLYKLSKAGIYKILHSFTGGTTDGCEPYGTPTMDSHGNLYGTTYGCGSANGGIVWKLSTNGNESVLHNFTSDGANPQAGVILDAKGNLYGDTQGGGFSGYGIVFKLSMTGKETVLHNFKRMEGASEGGLVRDAKGDLYGTSAEGGRSNCKTVPQGCGTVWKLTP
jgi:uncharacterized repeat protein (TIGR03803 family)